ncbi:MAG: helix-turn-helix domain-containing protein, partial [Nitrospirota bacterium]
MSLEEREYIGILLAKGESLRSIGKELGRNHSSISRELNINAPPVHKGYY